jgi:carbohydrate-selective porin OprB
MPRTQWLDPSQTNAGSYGFGVSFDQKIYDNITPFMRYGWRSPDVFDAPAFVSGGYTTLLGQAWSLGIQFGGALWRRETDAVGLAFGQVLPSADYKTANSLLHASAESHGEAYWRIQVFESLSISPDFQYIIGPFGKDAPENTKNIAVIGVRSQADF